MVNLRISAHAASNVGKRRQNNEDNYYLEGKWVDSKNETFATVAETQQLMVAVCDGMGGESAGEVASQIAVETVKTHYRDLLDNNLSDAAIRSYVDDANELICNEISKCKKRMGTTYTLLGIKDGTVTASNIGDSRIYKFANGFLEQVSKDHTEAQSMVDAGLVTAEESMKIPEKHRLTQHLGIYPYEMVIEPYTVRLDARDGDVFLLCSDGLTDMLTPAEIADILCKKQSLQDRVNELINQALLKGGKDNVTVILCELKKEYAPPVISEQEYTADNTEEPAPITKQEKNEEKSSKEKLLEAFEVDSIDDEAPVSVNYPAKVKTAVFEEKPTKKSKKLPLIIVAIVIAAIALSLCVVKALNNKDNKKQVTESVAITTATTASSTSKNDTIKQTTDTAADGDNTEKIFDNSTSEAAHSSGKTPNN